MAEFTKALELVLAHEGGYGNDPDDPGGETYKGVSRKMHPLWLGWHTIDMLKKQENFPKNLEANSDLQHEVESFYKVQFWNRISGALIQEQAVADSIFDFAVNAGISTSVSLAQKVVGVKDDGINGPDTLQAINKFNVRLFIAEFKLARINRYIAICNKRPTSKKYFFGWICRVLGV